MKLGRLLDMMATQYRGFEEERKWIILSIILRRLLEGQGFDIEENIEMGSWLEDLIDP